jgi:small subunit ribosomal protein S17
MKEEFDMVVDVRSVSGTVARRVDRYTVVVLVETMFQHKIYKKFIKRVTKMLVHDDEGMVQIGDTVKVISTRPYSKRKSWKLLSSTK